MYNLRNLQYLIAFLYWRNPVILDTRTSYIIHKLLGAYKVIELNISLSVYSKSYSWMDKKCISINSNEGTPFHQHVVT